MATIVGEFIESAARRAEALLRGIERDANSSKSPAEVVRTATILALAQVETAKVVDGLVKDDLWREPTSERTGHRLSWAMAGHRACRRAVQAVLDLWREIPHGDERVMQLEAALAECHELILAAHNALAPFVKPLSPADQARYDETMRKLAAGEAKFLTLEEAKARVRELRGESPSIADAS